MSKKIEITVAQKNQFNKMLMTLQTIAKYDDSNKLRESSKDKFELTFDKAIVMQHDIILLQSHECCKRIKPIGDSV
ncbi:hypothetical protein [Niabella beijingensis]|uniref:hypothetical protein n=1 Tax=Niabella beijingensis TaxID=2872700 RepID=UPI001CC037E1|nr:hypothetical protein [Niabella beijingensis]MBZ4190642.1 hypothetical protein [Niabella beijingensis]